MKPNKISRQYAADSVVNAWRQICNVVGSGGLINYPTASERIIKPELRNKSVAVAPFDY